MSQKYWAADEADKLVSSLWSKMRRSDSGASYSSLYDSIVRAGQRNLLAYYSPILNSNDNFTSLGYSGDKGEVILMKVPLARTYARQFVALVTKDRLSFEALVDVKSATPQETAKLAKSLVNYMAEKNQLDILRQTATEKSLITGNAFYSIIWDPDAGDELDVDDDGNVIRMGDNVINVHPLWEVTYDFNVQYQNLKWVCIAVKKNKWDLAARYPDLEKEILGSPSCDMVMLNAQAGIWRNVNTDSDFIYEYHFFHLPTSAVKNGRHTVFVGDNAVLIDEAYDCPHLPFSPMIIEPVQETGLGYPSFSSMLPTQEIIDATLSSITSNQLNVSGNIILIPEGSGITPTQISKGLKALPYKPMNIPNGGKPEILQLNSVNPQFFEFSQTCIGLLDQISMITPTLRGSPPSNVTSGQMAATLISSSLEFMSSASIANSLAIERIMTVGIRNYQKYATEHHIVKIVGKDNLYRVRNFKSGDLSAVSRVKIREQSPIMQTTAGRMAMGEALLAKNQADAMQYINLVEGAPVDEIYEDKYSELQAVKREVESFVDGENIVPNMLQNHPLFIKEYKKLLDNTPVAARSKILQDTLTLIMEHLNMEEQLQANPLLYQILRQGEPPPMGNQPMPEQAAEPSDVQQSELPVAEPADPSEPLPM